MRQKATLYSLKVSCSKKKKNHFCIKEKCWNGKSIVDLFSELRWRSTELVEQIVHDK